MELAKRKSPRIPGYSYATPNYYFITICTHNKECIFGKPSELNRFGEYARAHLLKIPEFFPSIRVDQYVVMPNHVHAILVVAADADEEMDLSVVIGQYKMSVTKRIREHCPQKIIWQRSFHDHVIRNQSSYEKIWLYIEHNPAKWEDDCFYLKDPETESLREGQCPSPTRRIAMYLSIGNDMAVRDSSIIGIFDMDNTTTSRRTREFLEKAEREGQVVPWDDLPKSFILTAEYGLDRVYLTNLSTATLEKRLK